MKIFNIFCDASVGPELRGACSGVLVEQAHLNNEGGKITQIIDKKDFYALIQPNGTNNSGEVAAVSLGIIQAINIWSRLIPNGENDAVFNLFSDSLITINGLREWLPGWVARSREDKEGIWYNSSNKVVKNQEYFKFIYNLLLMNPDFRIHLYHQDGHITSNFDQILPRFRQFNGIYLSDLCMNAAHICINNDTVDRESRRIINSYLNNGDTCGYPVEVTFDNGESIFPKRYAAIDNSNEAINSYLKCICKV